MNKNELVEAIAKQTKLSKKQAGSALQATLDSISDAMKKGQRVALVGFGTFGAVMRKARKGIEQTADRSHLLCLRRADHGIALRRRSSSAGCIAAAGGSWQHGFGDRA